MTIAVIDDGVNNERFLDIGPLAFDLQVNADGKLLPRIGGDPHAASHGTTCAAIITKYSPKTEIGSIQVLSAETGRGEPKQMTAALEWCMEQKIPLIHMSIGSRLFRDFPCIRDAANRLLKSGTILVAALANTMRYSAPACLEGVIGVRTSSVLHEEQYYPLEGGIFEVQFAASSRHTLTNYAGERKETPQCNSFAAPLITARAYQILRQSPGAASAEIVERLGGRIRSIHERLADTPFLKRRGDVPIIAVQGEAKKAVTIEGRLLRLLWREDYACMGFHTGVEQENDLNQLPPNVSPKDFLCYLAQMLELDAVLLADNDTPWADARLHVQNSRQRIHFAGDDIFFPEYASDTALKRVLRYLEKGGGNT